jgi:hypothetical protein
MANMGRIERQLLNEAVNRLILRPGGEQNDLTITEARNLIPEKARDELRLRARNLAWQSLVPDAVFEREPMPEALRISETIAHIQEHLQDRASVAQAARDDFVAEKVYLAEEQLKDGRAASGTTGVDRKQFVQTVTDARRLAALERYATQTREDVYRGFEILDAQFRDLEQTRAHVVKQVQEIEVSHLDEVVQTDQQWHFDSLREILNGEMNRQHDDPHERDDRELNFGLARLESVYER